MGTRARVNVIDGNNVLLSIYRQYDGYPSGLGADILNQFKDCQITNGISGPRDALGKSANGMGCLAAQLVKSLKNEIGNVYIRDTSDDSHGEEFSYSLSERNGKLHLSVSAGSVTWFGLPGTPEKEMPMLYSGPLADFDPNKLDGE